ncbi:MAG: hypothetical protein IJ946_04585, partial [Clostridia bacterium]|nr:hypothetical protein [Clostridia bacterium]
MNNENGFQVNTDVKVKPKKKRSAARSRRIAILMGLGVIAVIAAAVIIFCSTVPVSSVTVIDYCVIENADGNVQTDYYDQNGRVVKQVYTYMGVENGFTVLTYDNDGKVLKEESTYQGMLTTVNTYVYQGNRLIRIESRTPDNILTSRVEYMYNQDGTVTMELVYDSEEVINAQYNHTYENGRRTQTTLMYVSSNYSEAISYTYDAKGNLIKEVRNSEKSEKVTDYTYDNDGKVLSKKTTGGEYVVYK